MSFRLRRGLGPFLCGCLLAALAGCMPAGPRALLRGERRLEARDYPAALEELKEAVTLLATNAQAWNHLGLAYHYSGKSAQALEAYHHALVLDRNLASACFNAGCLNLETGNYSAAVDYLTTFTSLQPRSTDGWLRLGSAQIHLAVLSPPAERIRMLEAARRSYEFVTRVHPSAEALNGLGLISAYRGRGRETLGYFEAALQTQPGYPPALLNRAVYDERMNDRRAALAGYREYLALRPPPQDSAAVEALVGRIERELAPASPRVVATNAAPPAATNIVVAPPPATNRMVKLLPSPPPPPPVARSESKPIPKPAPAEARPVEKPLPVTHLPLSPPVHAPVEIVSSAKLPPVYVPPASNNIPTNVPAATPSQPVPESPLVEAPARPPEEKRGILTRLNPANWFVKKKKAPPAEVRPEPDGPPSDPVPPIAAAPVAHEDRPPIPRYHYLHPGNAPPGNRAEAMRSFDRGMIEQRALRYPEAVRLYEVATSLDPSFFEAYYNLGLAAFERGDTAVSLTAYEHALALKADFADLRYNFALALLKGGYAIDAADEFQRLATAFPDDARVHLSLANIYAQKLLDYPSARKHYQRVLELNPRHPQAPAIRAWLAGNPE